jgi:hypothetical protein
VIPKFTFLIAAGALLLPAAIGFSARAQDDVSEAEKRETNGRIAFFQTNFDKFVPVKFEKTTNFFSVMQRLKVRENLFDYEGGHYCGFRFTVPEWADGDFWWLQVLDKTEAQKDFSTSDMDWYIVPEKGTMQGFEFYFYKDVKNIKFLHKRFPYTKHFYYQKLPQGRLIPGANYAIWFRMGDTNCPDIAFTMTIDSARGHQEFGEIPAFIQNNRRPDGP